MRHHRVANPKLVDHALVGVVRTFEAAAPGCYATGVEDRHAGAIG